MTLRKVASVASGCALALLLHASTACADDTDAARAAMRRGLDALERRDATSALAEYETAKRLVPTANAPYYFAASALEMLGRWREAVENLEAYLAKDPTVSDVPQVKERITNIRATRFPARLVVRVAGSDEATVSVDGDAKGRPGAMELPAGPHRIEVQAPSRLPTSQTIELVGDTEVAVTLTLTPAPLGTSPTAAPPVEPRPPSPAWRTAGWITAGVGAATLATAFTLDALILGPKIDDYNAASARADPAARGFRREAEGLQTALLATYVTGAVIAAGGLALILFAPRASSMPARARSSAVFAF